LIFGGKKISDVDRKVDFFLEFPETFFLKREVAADDIKTGPWEIG
jgi:hypothetical protein